MNRVFYVNELNSLVENVHTMGVDVLATLDKVIKNMENKDAALAQQIMANDDYFDNEELAIEKQCFKLLLLQAPVASDLREIASILKLVGDLERIADHCSDISQYTLNLTEMKPAPLPADFLEMMKLMRSMVSDSITAIHGNDAELAQKIIDTDNKVDTYFHSLRGNLTALMQDKPYFVPQYVNYLMIAKYVERIADHATNIAEWVIYIVKNELQN
jgi:phosphate transport system protein